MHTGRQMFRRNIEAQEKFVLSDAVSVMGTFLSACHFFAAVSGASVCRECVLQKGRKMENKFNNITEKTTLGELLDILQLGERPVRTPTPRFLRENSGEPVAQKECCIIYRNGWAVYEGESGYTVLWLPECTQFVYCFDKPKASEESVVPERVCLPAGLLASQPWPLAVTLLGEHRVETNMMNRTGSRKGTKAYEYDHLPEYQEDTPEDAFMKELFYQSTLPCENPETAYIRKELIQEMLDAMTDKQRKAFVLYYRYGYTQFEIADMMHISQQSVNRLLDRATFIAKKYLKSYCRGV